ncbi:MAG: hypothetical protein R2838_11190 [Caldilineaceae bacterium]
MKEAMAAQPTGFGRMLCALDMLLAPSARDRHRRRAGRRGDPGIVAHGAAALFAQHGAGRRSASDAASDLPLLAGRTLVDGKPAAYVCENYACNLPVTTPEELAALLGG